jgi:hypothetical protein
VPEYERRRKVLSELMAETRRWMLPAGAEEI